MSSKIVTSFTKAPSFIPQSVFRKLMSEREYNSKKPIIDFRLFCEELF
jgi:hypothetical protein